TNMRRARAASELVTAVDIGGSGAEMVGGSGTEMVGGGEARAGGGTALLVSGSASASCASRAARDPGSRHLPSEFWGQITVGSSRDTSLTTTRREKSGRMRTCR